MSDEKSVIVMKQPRQEVSIARQFEPANLNQLMELAKFLSDSSLVPKDIRGKPSDIALVIMRGYEIGGWSPALSTQVLHVINGKVAMEATAQRALCLLSPECEQFEVLPESDAAKATVRVKSRKMAAPVDVTFTIAEAKHLTGKDNWKNHGPDMLVARATTRAAKRYFPAPIMGILSVEEASEIGEGAGEPVKVDVAAKVVHAVAGAEPQQAIEPEIVTETPDEPIGVERVEELEKEAQKQGISPEMWDAAMTYYFGGDIAELPLSRWEEVQQLPTWIKERKKKEVVAS